jgi:dihydroorotase
MSEKLLLRGARVVDPSAGHDAIADVLFADGSVAAVGPALDAPSDAAIRDLSGLIVVPGLIDLHTHVYWGGTSLGIDADDFGRLCGVTTSVDAGSAGPGNFAGFRKHVIERSEVRILAFLHVAFPGIFAFSERGTLFPESSTPKLMAPDEAVAVIEANRDVIVGVKVRIGPSASGDQGVAPLKVACSVARRAGVPVMVHVEAPPPDVEEILAELQAGDILTHSFRPAPNSIVVEGRVIEAALEARRRGVFFDIGHGKGSFSFPSARALLDAGFPPDAISSDIHVASIKGPAYDQLVTLSKFLCLGMDFADVIAASTANPARIVGRPDLGSLSAGSVGDATVLSLEEGSFDYVDSRANHLDGKQRIALAGVVIGGRWWHSAGPEKIDR